MTDPTRDDVPALLVVDDQPANLLVLDAVLSPLGYRIVRARSGEDALKELAAHDFVLILMDVHMPGLDGYQTTELVRRSERTRDIPVVFLTAVYNQPEHTYRGYALGAVDYIAKPFDPEVLRGKVRSLVSLYTRGRRAERERAAEAERIKDLFLGAVGHDLRNPLNAILLASRLMLDDDGASPKQRGHAARIDRAGRRMQRILEDVLDLTRAQFAGKMPLMREKANLGDLCRAVVDELRLARPCHPLELRVTGDVEGTWDPIRLGRVASNLVGNAIEHSEEGTVQVAVTGEADRAVLEVHNGGRPIDPEILPAIFEPFRRGDKAADGLGLGLYIVREIVTAHSGSVDVRSSAAEGTTFRVVLPKSG